MAGVFPWRRWRHVPHTFFLTSIVPSRRSNSLRIFAFSASSSCRCNAKRTALSMFEFKHSNAGSSLDAPARLHLLERMSRLLA